MIITGTKDNPAAQQQFSFRYTNPALEFTKYGAEFLKETHKQLIYIELVSVVNL